MSIWSTAVNFVVVATIPFLLEKYAKGELGKKVGKGFYDYE